MVTIVSAFVSQVNERFDINEEIYISHGKKLLDVDIPKIIFLEQHLIDKYHFRENEFTKIISIKKEDLLYYNEIQNLEQIYWTRRPDKDTLEFIMVQSNKTDWVKKSIQINCFNTDQFIWIDFGISKLFSDENYFKSVIEKLKEKKYSKIRIGGCHQLAGYDHNIWTMPLFYFAGGVFGGHKDYLLKFAALTNDKCMWFMKERNTLVWEVNIWYLIYEDLLKENKQDFFSHYICDHNPTILENY